MKYSVYSTSSSAKTVRVAEIADHGFVRTVLLCRVNFAFVPHQGANCGTALLQFRYDKVSVFASCSYYECFDGFLLSWFAFVFLSPGCLLGSVRFSTPLATLSSYKVLSSYLFQLMNSGAGILLLDCFSCLTTSYPSCVSFRR